MTADYSKIAQYFASSHTPSSKANDIAKFILLNADVKRGNAGTTASSSPSLMSRIFDVLSRPRYALANTIKGAVEGGAFHPPNPADFISGLVGTQKTGFTDVLGELGVPDNTARTFIGLGLDLGLDPVNYIPVAGAASKIKNLVSAKKEIPEVTRIQELLSKNEPTNPELYGLPSEAKSVPPALTAEAATTPTIGFPKDVLGGAPKLSSKQLQLELPGVESRIPIPKTEPTSVVENIIPKARGQLAFKLDTKPVVGESATQIIDKASAGDVAAASRLQPSNSRLEFEPRHAEIADQILGKFDPAKSTAAINKAHPDTLNAKQQVWLYHRAINAAKQIVKKPEWVASHANKIYAAIESSLRAKGYVPRLGTGENVSLYDAIKQAGGLGQAKDVLDNFAKDLTPNNPIWNHVQGLRAANAIDDSKSVKFILDKAAEARSTISASGALSDAGEKIAYDHILRLAKKASVIAPISAASKDATAKLLNQVFASGKTAAQVAIEQKSAIIDEIISKGSGRRAELNQSITRALEKDLGKLPTWSVDRNQSVEFFMGRVATWWGQKDLRPFSLNAIGSSSATAAARGKALHSVFKGFDITQRAEAMAIAQGFGKPTSVDTARLADEITKMMSNLVGQVSGSSVVLRSAVDRELLNKWMRNYGAGFTFTTDNAAKDITGVVHDFSKGTDWLNSWKVVGVKEDPEKFLFKLQQAMEQSTREKALFDELGERFGKKIAGGGFKVKLTGYPYLDGYYFSDDIAKQIPRVVRDWTNTLHTTDPLLRHYDRLLSMWKSGVTIYRPAHHIRNLIGDAYLGWMDNVRSIRPYMLAARVQRTLKGMYPTLSDVDKLVELGVVSRNLATPKIGEVIFRNKSGIPFTAQQIAAVAHQNGLLEHARTIEDIIDLGESSRFQPFGGKVQAVGRSASELISHNSRLAHFIDKVMKSTGSDLANIFEMATRRARKWHPTGLDLTPFERKFLRRVMPFYSWLRKSTPLLLEGLVMNPGKTLVAPKVYNAIQQAQGMDTGGINDPFPVDQMFPAWLRGEGLGPLSSSEGWLGKFSNQEPPGYVMAGQGLNPLTQLMSQLSQPGKTLLGSLTPAIGVPFSLASGQNISTGQPISGLDAQPGAMQEYVGSQIPIASMVQGISGVTPFGTPTKKSRGDQFTENLINWATGAGIKGTGPYIKQARFEKARPGQIERAARKQAFLEQLRGLS